MFYIDFVSFMLFFFRCMLKRPELINDCFSRLTSLVELKASTIKNYYQSACIFIEFLMAHTKCVDRVKYHQRLQTVLSTIKITSKANQRQISKDQNQKVFNETLCKQYNDYGFRKILYGSMCSQQKNRIKQTVEQSMELNDKERIFLLRYCVAIIVIKYCQRPSVATEFRLEEYERQHENSFIMVRNHKTGQTKPAYFPFTKEDKIWFSYYANFVRNY